MVDRAHAAWTNGHITGVLVMDIKAAFPSIAKERLVNLMKVRQMDGDSIRWTESTRSARTVEMVIERIARDRHPVEAGVPQGSPVSPILFAIYISGLIKWVEEYVSEVEGLSFVDDLGCVVTWRGVDHVVPILERCTAKSIERASRRGLQFDIGKTEAALFTRRVGHQKHLWAKLPAKIRVGKESVWINAQATCWLGVWMDAHPTFKEHLNRCVKKVSAVEARI
jgi:hypothetical protein